MGEELTGVTLGGFGGRSPPFSLPLPLLPSSLLLALLLGLSSLSGFLQWRWAAPHAVAAAAAGEARTPLGVFQNKFPPQLLLITVIIFII